MQKYDEDKTKIAFTPSDNRNDSAENPTNVTDLGRSICTSVAGLRYGFTLDNIVDGLDGW